MAPWYSNAYPLTAPTDLNSGTSGSFLLFRVSNDSSTTATTAEISTTFFYSTPRLVPPALPEPSRWYTPPPVAPSNRGPVTAYEATLRPRTIGWRSAPRASARRARRNWRKRPHGSKRRKLR